MGLVGIDADSWLWWEQECPERLVFDALMLWAFGISAPGPDAEPKQSLADIEALLLLIRCPMMAPADIQVNPNNRPYDCVSPL